MKLPNIVENWAGFGFVAGLLLTVAAMAVLQVPVDLGMFVGAMVGGVLALIGRRVDIVLERRAR